LYKNKSVILKNFEWYMYDDDWTIKQSVFSFVFGKLYSKAFFVNGIRWINICSGGVLFFLGQVA
jgi:hypothetical protein